MNIRNKKAFVLFTLALMAGHLLKAQTENTHERLITQLKNGTAPGLQFAPAQPVVTSAGNDKISAQQQTESLIAQIRKGTAPGMKFQAGTGATAARTARPVGPVVVTAPQTTVAKQGPLASEMEIPKALPKTTVTPVVPVQEEAVRPAPAEKQ